MWFPRAVVVTQRSYRSDSSDTVVIPCTIVGRKDSSAALYSGVEAPSRLAARTGTSSCLIVTNAYMQVGHWLSLSHKWIRISINRRKVVTVRLKLDRLLRLRFVTFQRIRRSYDNLSRVYRERQYGRRLSRERRVCHFLPETTEGRPLPSELV